MIQFYSSYKRLMKSEVKKKVVESEEIDGRGRGIDGRIGML